MSSLGSIGAILSSRNLKMNVQDGASQALPNWAELDKSAARAQVEEITAPKLSINTWSDPFLGATASAATDVVCGAPARTLIQEDGNVKNIVESRSCPELGRRRVFSPSAELFARPRDGRRLLRQPRGPSANVCPISAVWLLPLSRSGPGPDVLPALRRLPRWALPACGAANGAGRSTSNSVAASASQ